MSAWENAPKNSQAVFEHLKLLAEQMRVESYGEIAKTIGEAEGREIAPISLSKPLGFIRDSACSWCPQHICTFARQNQSANAERASRWLVPITRIGRRQPGLDALEQRDSLVQRFLGRTPLHVSEAFAAG